MPRQAVFQKNGKNHVFVKAGDRFEQREVKIVQRTESRVAVSGLAEGTEVALVDPSSQARPLVLVVRLADAGRRSAEMSAAGSAAPPRTSCRSSGSGSRTSARTSCARC